MNITEIAGLEETEKFEVEWTSTITQKTITVKFEARVASLTPKFFDQIGSYSGYPKVVADLVTDWDVTGADGEKWPLTEADLKLLPVPFLTAIIDKATESWAGDKKKPKKSGNTSGSGGELGVLHEEWLVHEAAEFLGCSYIDLDEHPRKHSLMSTAFTVQSGIRQGNEIIKANSESKAKMK